MWTKETGIKDSTLAMDTGFDSEIKASGLNLDPIARDSKLSLDSRTVDLTQTQAWSSGLKFGPLN